MYHRYMCVCLGTIDTLDACGCSFPSTTMLCAITWSLRILSLFTLANYSLGQNQITRPFQLLVVHLNTNIITMIMIIIIILLNRAFFMMLINTQKVWNVITLAWGSL